MPSQYPSPSGWLDGHQVSAFLKLLTSTLGAFEGRIETPETKASCVHHGATREAAIPNQCRGHKEVKNFRMHNELMIKSTLAAAWITHSCQDSLGCRGVSLRIHAIISRLLSRLLRCQKYRVRLVRVFQLRIDHHQLIISESCNGSVTC